MKKYINSIHESQLTAENLLNKFHIYINKKKLYINTSIFIKNSITIYRKAIFLFLNISVIDHKYEIFSK